MTKEYLLDTFNMKQKQIKPIKPIFNKKEDKENQRVKEAKEKLYLAKYQLWIIRYNRLEARIDEIHSLYTSAFGAFIILFGAWIIVDIILRNTGLGTVLLTLEFLCIMAMLVLSLRLRELVSRQTRVVEELSEIIKYLKYV